MTNNRTNLDELVKFSADGEICSIRSIIQIAPDRTVRSLTLSFDGRIKTEDPISIVLLHPAKLPREKEKDLDYAVTIITQSIIDIVQSDDNILEVIGKLIPLISFNIASLSQILGLTREEILKLIEKVLRVIINNTNIKIKLFGVPIPSRVVKTVAKVLLHVIMFGIIDNILSSVGKKNQYDR